MLSITDNRLAHCCAGDSRRDFLRIGALGVGGLTLVDLLQARANASSPLGKTVRDKFVVLLFLNGGPSHIESFDPRMTAPSEIHTILRRSADETRGDYVRCSLSANGPAGRPVVSGAFLRIGQLRAQLSGGGQRPQPDQSHDGRVVLAGRRDKPPGCC